ncbi:MAG: hypothetical protein EXQ58_01215, partial [Acidobacteria bacterium]|nr:hypothetical protein [Acidobacteriota bacterium]
MKTSLALLLVIQLTNASLAQAPLAARASARAEQIQQTLQERTKSPIKNLDIDLIMLGPDFAGTAPDEVSWAGDNSKLWFRWKRPGEKESGLFEVVRTGGNPRRLTKDEEAGAPPYASARDQSGRWAVYSFEGDICLLDTHFGKLRKITQTAEAETEPSLTHDEKKISFRRGDNLFLIPREGEPLLQQLTDIRSGKDPEVEKEKKEKEGQRKYLKDQQEELFAVLQTKAKKQTEDDDRKKARRPQPLYIEDKKVERLSLSADERFVAVELVEEPKEQQTAQVPDYVTLSGFTDEAKARVKVGDLPKRYSLAVLNLETSRALQVRLEDQATQSPASEPKQGKDSKSKTSSPDAFSPVWSRTGHLLLATIRSTSNKDQWLLSFDAETGDKRVMSHEHDDAWVLNDDDAPSLSLLEYGFFDEGRKVWFVSEHTGFRHLYAMPVEGGPAQALTEGRHEIWNAKLSRDEQTFYFRSNQDGPEVMHFYALPAGGGTPQKM